jgi:hypothetical protein
VTIVRFTVDLRWQELVGVRACSGCDAREFVVSGRRSDRCGRVVRSGGSDDLSSDESEFLRKINSKERTE